MTVAGLLIFCLTYVLAVAAPGPGVAALVARALSRGTRRIVPFIAGFVAGDLTLFAIAVGGLSVLAQTMGELFTILRYAGAAYLLYMGWKMWTAPVETARDTSEATDKALDHGGRLFLTGYTVTIGNPKAILFFMALLPTVVDLTRVDLGGAAVMGACIAVLMSLVLGGYALTAARIRRVLTSARAIRRLNRGTGAVMAGAAIAIATR